MTIQSRRYVKKRIDKLERKKNKAVKRKKRLDKYREE